MNDKNFEQMVRKIYEASSLPNPANLKKPGVGAGSGQHSVGNMNVQTKSLSQAVSDTSSYSAQSEINRPKLSTAPAAQKPTTGISTPTVDNAVKAKASADKAAAVSRAKNTNVGSAAGGNYQSAQAKRIFPKPGNGPMGTQLGIANRNAPTSGAAKQNMVGVQAKQRNDEIKTAVQRYAQTPKGASQAARKGNDMNGPSSGKPLPTKAPNAADNVKDNHPATNRQLTAQAIARKGFGSSAGGNYPAAQTKNPPSSGTAQAATPPKTGGNYGSAQQQFDAQQKMKSAQAPSSMGAALKAAAARGEKTAKFGGKEYKVDFKDKAYQSRLSTKASQLKAGQAQRGRPANVQEDVKELAEMIKSLRKEKLEQLQEYQSRSKRTTGYVGSKIPSERMSIRDKSSRPLSGKDVQNRYKLSSVVEAEEELKPTKGEKTKKKVKDTINFEPQQSDTRIF